MFPSFRKFTLKESFWFALTSFTPQGGGEPPKGTSIWHFFKKRNSKISFYSLQLFSLLWTNFGGRILDLRGPHVGYIYGQFGRIPHSRKNAKPHQKLGTSCLTIQCQVFSGECVHCNDVLQEYGECRRSSLPVRY